MAEIVYKVVQKTEEKSVYVSPGIAAGELECVYMHDFTTHPRRGTPGLFAFRSLEDAREYQRLNPTRNVIFEAETSAIVDIDIPARLPLPDTQAEAEAYWQAPYAPCDGYETPRGTVLCVDITPRRLVA